MQEIKPDGTIGETIVGDANAMVEALAKKLNQPLISEPQADGSLVIGKLPEKGKTYLINGMQYRCTHVNGKSGRVHFVLAGTIRSE